MHAIGGRLNLNNLNNLSTLSSRWSSHIFNRQFTKMCFSSYGKYSHLGCSFAHLPRDWNWDPMKSRLVYILYPMHSVYLVTTYVPTELPKCRIHQKLSVWATLFSFWGHIFYRIHGSPKAKVTFWTVRLLNSSGDRHKLNRQWTFKDWGCLV